MIRAKLIIFLLVLMSAAALDASAQCSATVGKTSAASSYAASGLGTQKAFSIVERGAATFDSNGTDSAINVGYARVQANTGSTTPAGYLIFSFHQNGVLVTEATVPAVRPMSAGRIYAAFSGPVNTGLAMVNPNATPATVSFYFTDASGNSFGNGSFVLPANSQIARFVNEAPFGATGSLNGTMTFSSDQPVGVIALRGFTNERGEFLITTLPVADLAAGASSETVFLPHYASGGGWTTQVVLVNPTDTTISGNVEFLAGGSAAAYSIPPRSMQRIVAANGGASITTGAIRVTPAAGSPSPSGLSIFSFVNGGITVSEAGVPVLRAAQAFRMFDIECGTYPGQLNTGIAIANPSAAASAVVTLDMTDLNGAVAGASYTFTLAPLSQRASFIKEIPGFGSLPYPFHGNLRVSTTSAEGIAVVGLRGEYNERNDFLVTTSMPTNEATVASSGELLFPHLADGAGYSTEFVLFSGSTGQAPRGMLKFFTQAGAPLN